MKKELGWPLVAMMVLALSGCGLKGPLYFPPSDKPKTETAQPDSGKTERNQQDLSGAKQSQTIAGPQ
ncbi:LPS translocon maturation chaperone LptM [Yersinia aleksiciae]|uniref:LPS-assembly lipoprotein LptM n=1 Tax=Yersinia aleksiciae TaxID=263819 RepID=A0A0T9ULJ3_YERAE|nr:lipoprotein [Yersinia aleksiciae]AKP33880.1 hypothetical protein ACZ76_10175 [Yersinia aleksiciae]MDA5499343.1 lipoprotein [Yersinia aleksiciae]NIL00368.1 hypothetical protein [Yersinia aleksiciae]WQC70988.1 lipoprotein [Yersinia aleksiciae]CFQ49954.1 putative lipoprotein [Yersinia aleksiciae]